MTPGAATSPAIVEVSTITSPGTITRRHNLLSPTLDVELYMQVSEGIEHYKEIDPEEDCL